MKQTKITLSCGHVEKHRLHGSPRNQEALEREISARKCASCLQAEQQAERAARNAESAARNAAAGLPALQGTPKQIAWAETIRAEARRRFAELDVSALDYEFWADETPQIRARAEALIREDIEATMNRTKAAWWIEVGRIYTAEWTETQIYYHLRCPAQERLGDEIDQGLFAEDGTPATKSDRVI